VNLRTRRRVDSSGTRPRQTLAENGERFFGYSLAENAQRQGREIAALRTSILNRIRIVPHEPDFIIQNHGSIFLFDPQNTEAENHLLENVSEEAQWFGGALIVEPRYVADLAGALQSIGFKIACGQIPSFATRASRGISRACVVVLS
jgi:hypothetical protein